MKPTVTQYAQAFLNLSGEISPSEKEKVSSNFLNLLRRRKEMKKLPAIVRRIDRLMEEKEGVKRVEVISARALDEKETSEIAERARGIFRVGEVRLDLKIDPTVRGGIILKTETEMMDISVASRIRNLQKILLQ